MIFDISDENKNKTGIYCITSLIDNKKYIGQTMESFYERWIRHSNLMLNHKHFNKHIQNAYDKYGSDNFVMNIVEICSDASEIAKLEEKYITEYRSKCECYNFLSGGETMSKENNPFYGKTHTEKTKKKLSETHIGKNKGKLNNFYGDDHSGVNNGFYGHKHSEESRKKMSKTKSEMYKGVGNPFFGKKHTEEARLKMKDNGQNAMKKVMCVETGVIYNSIKNAAESTNTCARSISAVCCERRQTANNLHWVFAN